MKRDQREALESAASAWVQATGVLIDRTELERTARRVAGLWQQEFLSGYEMDSAAILGRGNETGASGQLVIVTSLNFHAMCPHHLLPYQGVAHLGYVVDERVVGFGQLAEVLRCFTQRLTLQEQATDAIADALCTQIPSRGGLCAMQAHHLCLSIPSDRHQASQVHTESFSGVLAEDASLRGQAIARLPAPC